MAGPNERELKLKLTVDAPDPSKPSRAFQDIANQAQRTSLAVQDVNRQMQRMGAGPGGMSYAGGMPHPAMTGGVWTGYHPPQPYVYGGGYGAVPVGQQQNLITPAAGAAAKGGGGGFVGSMIKGSATAGLVADTAASMATAFQQLDHQFLTVRERMLGVYRSIPLVGDSIAGMVDNVITAVERLRNPAAARRYDELQYRAPFQTHFVGAEANRYTSAMGLIREQRGAEYGLQALRDFPIEQFFTRPGESSLENRNRQALLESRNATAIGGRAMRQAELEAEFTRQEYRQRREAYSFADERRRQAKIAFDQADAASKNPNSPGGGLGSLDLNSKRLEYQIALKEAAAELAKLENATTANKEKQLAFIQKEAEYRKLMTGEMKTQLSILQEEAARGRQMAQTFGALDSVGQRGILDAAERYKRGGKDFVTAQELASLRQFAPETIGRDLEKEAAANPLFAQLQKTLGIRDLETVNREIGKLEAQIALHVKFDEEETAKSLKAALDRLNLQDLLGKIVNDKFRIELEQFRIQQGAGRSSGN